MTDNSDVENHVQWSWIPCD